MTKWFDLTEAERDRHRRADERRRRAEHRLRVQREIVAELERLGGPLLMRLPDRDREALADIGASVPPVDVTTLRTGHVRGCADAACPGWPCVPTTGQAPPRGRA